MKPERAEIMSALEVQQRYYTPEEYLALEREADFKSEYFDGGIYAMSGGMPMHSKIINNTSAAITAQLWNSPCDGHNAEFKSARAVAEATFYVPGFHGRLRRFPVPRREQTTLIS